MKVKIANVYTRWFGMIVYGIYDFTAGSVFTDWDSGLALIDVLWGSFVYMLSALVYGISLKKMDVTKRY